MNATATGKTLSAVADDLPSNLRRRWDGKRARRKGGNFGSSEITENPVSNGKMADDLLRSLNIGNPSLMPSSTPLLPDNSSRCKIENNISWMPAYKKSCSFFCQKCFTQCLCVPRGAYGNKQVHPYYNNQKTKGEELQVATHFSLK